MLSSKPMQAISRAVFVRRTTAHAAMARASADGMPSSAAYRYLSYFSSSQHARFISSKNTTTTITSKLHTAPEVLYYESDSTNNDAYDKTSFHHQHITHHALQQRHGDENDVSYEQDYDADNLHMTPGSTTSQDSEQFDELEVHYDDINITTVRDGDSTTTAASYYDDVDDTYIFANTDEDGDEYEFEEDWELMHSANCQGDSTQCDILDQRQL